MSASKTFLIPNDGVTSTATFTALCLAISQQFDLYIPVTADTGQTTFLSTVGALPTVNAYPYFQMRQLNDATQSTYPIFIKIEYGYGSQTRFGLRISVGVATNGAGGLTGTPSSFFYVGTYAVNTLALPCYFSGNGSRIQFLLFNNDVNASNNTAAFSLTRLRDNTGAYVTTQSCVNIVEASLDAGIIGLRSKRQQTYVGGVANPATPIQVNPAIPNWGSGTWGANVQYAPVYPMLGYAGAADFSILFFLSAAVAVSANRLVQLNIYGAPHTYIARSVDTGNVGLNGNGGAYSFMMLYE